MRKIKLAVSAHWKRYIVSSAVSFASAFAVVVLSEIDNISLQSFKDGVFIGVVFMALRAGVKAILEYGVSAMKKTEKPE